jgi:hypothetical protein
LWTIVTLRSHQMNSKHFSAVCLLVGLALLGSSASLHAAYSDDWARMKDITPRNYLCYQAPAAVQIDGKLDDAAWKTAPWTEGFVDIEGPAKPKPRFRTRAKMLWDDQYFYVAAELEEPHVWATLTNHDAVIFHDPDFEVFIDPDGDSHDYYEFEMNSLNTSWDLRLPKPYKDGGPALNEWEIPGLKTAVHIQGTLNNSSDRDQGWTLEIAFPWQALGEFARCPAPPREGDQWRVSFSRVEWLIDIIDGQYRKVPGKKENNWVWSPQGIIDMHRPEKWGFVQFTKQKPGQAKFVPDPSAQARAVLQEIYYAQKDFQKANKRWAESLAELKLANGLGSKIAKPPSLQATPDGYHATAGIKLPDGRLQLWHIRQDARVWSE